jgi:ubiquinone/menaquinone biosynthesis C-methylase UbiE
MISIADLRTVLDKEPLALGSSWLSTLDERKQEEASFHDDDRTGHHDETQASSPNRRFYEAGDVVVADLESWLERRAKGRVFLDYACGNGLQTVRALNAGVALAVGIDISEVSIHNARDTVRSAGFVDRAYFLQRDCENTKLPSNTFDACLCAGMLHHLDLQHAYPELHRIMAPGGRILAMEALSYNPFINLYRSRTPELRTEWESNHILSLRDVELAKRWFRVENVKYYLMSAPLATLLPRPLRRAGLAVGHAVDALLTRTPLLQLWSWQFSFELVKE